MPQYDWIIIGGGLHGVFHAYNLAERQGVSPEAIAILDPQPALLQRWLQQCRRCGMEFLRSSSSHCLSTDFRALRRFARTHGYPDSHFLQPYSRPSLELFTAHSYSCIADSRLTQQHIRDRAVSIRQQPRGWRVNGVNSEFNARAVLLAPGRTPPPLPDWAGELPQEKLAVLLDPGVGSGVDELPVQLRTAIVGGGISGIGAAVYAADRRAAVALEAGRPAHTVPVDLYCTRSPEAHLFDFDPGYVGPKRQGLFATADPVVRARLVRAARNSGTATPELLQRFLAHAEHGRINIQVRAIQRADQVAHYDRVLIAGGTGTDTPEIFRHTAAKTDVIGYPILRDDCSWAKGLYVSGAAASGVIGPAAPNIIGAHLAFRRIHAMRSMRG